MNKEAKSEIRTPEVSQINSVAEVLATRIAVNSIKNDLKITYENRNCNLLDILKFRISSWVNRIDHITDKAVDDFDIMKLRFDGYYNSVIHQLNTSESNKSFVETQKLSDAISVKFSKVTGNDTSFMSFPAKKSISNYN